MASTLLGCETAPPLDAREPDPPPRTVRSAEHTPQVVSRGKPSASHKDARYWERISALVSGCDPLTSDQIDRLRKIMR